MRGGWPCFEDGCPAHEHSPSYKFCPYTGVDRKAASRRGDLLAHTESDLLRLANFGPRCLKQVRSILSQKNYHLGSKAKESNDGSER